MANKERLRMWADELPNRNQAMGFLTVAVVAADGTETLHQCCLGVACDVAIANGLTMVVTRKEMAEGDLALTGIVLPDGATAYCVNYDYKHNVLPEAACGWYDLESPDPALFIDGIERPDGHDLALKASEWNDDHEADFTQIRQGIITTYELD